MATTYKTKDSGERVDFATGARRDVETNKGRFDLIPYEAMLRLAQLYERGADKYGENNYQLGIPLKRLSSSCLRHCFQMADGQEDEDHAAAVIWNAIAYLTTKARIERGELPKELLE